MTRDGPDAHPGWTRVWQERRDVLHLFTSFNGGPGLAIRLLVMSVGSNVSRRVGAGVGADVRHGVREHAVLNELYTRAAQRRYSSSY